MRERYKRHFLKTREAKSILTQASGQLGVNLKQIFKSEVEMELVETEFAEIFLINGRLLLVRIGGKILPTLAFRELFALMPSVVVDMGAVPHVCNGANIMAPGIVRYEGEFKKDDFVLVVDEEHGKKIAIGQAIYDVDAAKKAEKGVVVKNVHFVGDKIWNFIKKFESP